MAAPLAIISGVVQAVGQISAGRAAAAAGDYNARIAEQNAVLSRQQAAEDERRQRVTARKQIGENRAVIGASGVNLEGSVLDVLEESAANAELDALQIRHGGEARARGFINDAQIERFSGGQAKTGGYLGGASSLLSGSSSAAGMKRGKDV